MPLADPEPRATTPTARSSIIDSARGYIQNGWRPVPLVARGKRPVAAGWPQYVATETVLHADFSGRCNLGLILGSASGGLVDIDLDDFCARALAPEFLPETSMRHGRSGAPLSHYWYLPNPLPPTQKFIDPTDQRVILEIRSDGAQTMVPPSVHPSGEAVAWDTAGDPSRVDGEILTVSAGRLAAAALLARHWPKRGSRHDAVLASAGMLIRAGWPVEDAATFISRVALAADDEEWAVRARDVLTTGEKVMRGEPATGAPGLARLISEVVVRKAAEWLGIVWPSPASTQVTDSANSANSADMWETPVEFSSGVYGPPAPLESFPLVIGDHIRSAAAVHQFPVDLMAGATLGALAASAAGRVEVKIGETHNEPVNLYVAPVAASGERKKSALGEAVFPLQVEEK